MYSSYLRRNLVVKKKWPGPSYTWQAGLGPSQMAMFFFVTAVGQLSSLQLTEGSIRRPRDLSVDRRSHINGREEIAKPFEFIGPHECKFTDRTMTFKQPARIWIAGSGRCLPTFIQPLFSWRRILGISTFRADQRSLVICSMVGEEKRKTAKNLIGSSGHFRKHATDYFYTLLILYSRDDLLGSKHQARRRMWWFDPGSAAPQCQPTIIPSTQTA